MKKTSPDSSVKYTYDAQNRLVRGETSDGESSVYTYNALGVRIANTQVRVNENAHNRNSDLKDGSHDTDYLDFLADGRETWQRAWETEVGTTVQPDTETVTRRYVVDYLSAANRDIFVIEEGSYTQRFVYDEKGMRVTAEFDYAPNTRRGEGGENLQSDIAVELGKIWYKNSQIGTAVYAVDSDCKTVSHMIYDAWGEPQRGTYIDTNFSGIDALANFTGYTWDEVLELYFAQNRFYDPADRRFTQEDIVKDSHNWYAYCGNNPTLHVDPLGLRGEEIVDSLQGIFDEIREYASEQREWWSERWSEIYEWLTTSRSMSQLTYGLSNNFNYFARNTCDVMYAATLLANYIQISNCNTTNSDGEYQYIYNQNSEPIGSLPFGLSTFAHSGCGVVATYNSLITLGKPESLADVDLAYGIIGKNIGGWLGVHPEAITEFFESRDDINVKPVYKEDVSSLAEFDEIFANADVAIVTYWIYGKSATIHNVAIRPIRDSFGRVTDIYTYNEYSDMHEEFSRLSIEEMLKSGNRDVIVINYLYNTAAGDTSVVSNIPSIEELSAKRKNGGGTRSIDLKM